MGVFGNSKSKLESCPVVNQSMGCALTLLSDSLPSPFETLKKNQASDMTTPKEKPDPGQRAAETLVLQEVS